VNENKIPFSKETARSLYEQLDARYGNLFPKSGLKMKNGKILDYPQNSSAISYYKKPMLRHMFVNCSDLQKLGAVTIDTISDIVIDLYPKNDIDGAKEDNSLEQKQVISERIDSLKETDLLRAKFDLISYKKMFKVERIQLSISTETYKSRRQ